MMGGRGGATGGKGGTALLGGAEVGTFGAGAVTGTEALDSAAARNLTPEQSAALERMGGDGSYVVNADLRNQRGDVTSLTPKNQTTVEQTDSVMSGSSLPHDTVVYRQIGDPQRVLGQEIDSSTGDVSGLSWRDHGYTSTSVFERGNARIQMRILVPKGTPGVSSRLLDSDEVLLGRGLKYTVVRDHGPTVIRHLDVVVSR